MAQRQGIIRVDASDVQGDGAYVVVRKLGYAQRQTATRMMADAFGGKLPQNLQGADITLTSEFLAGNDAYTRDLLTENVLEWDWVDDAGKKMPIPSADPDVIKKLTDDEVNFLARAIQGGQTAAETKN